MRNARAYHRRRGRRSLRPDNQRGECEHVSLHSYILSRVIHDWADDKAVEVLNVVRRAMPVKGRLLLFETMIRARSGQKRSIEPSIRLRASS